MFLVVSGIVFAVAKATPFEKDTGGGDVLALGDAARGEALFATNCSGCHGADARGGVGPALRGSGIGLLDARGVIRTGRGIMPAGIVSGADEEDVLAYLGEIVGGR
jgi:cytochrome c551